MIGYHFTTESNWIHISKEGLQPYEIRKPEVEREFTRLKIKKKSEPVYGIFLWLERQHGRELMGSLMWHALGKGSDRVVEIEVTYEPDWRLKRESDEMSVTLYHDMNSNRDASYRYWHDSVPACLLKYTVPRSRLRLLRVFDLTTCELLAIDGEDS